jgi:predicted dienelactone hydrolase
MKPQNHVMPFFLQLLARCTFTRETLRNMLTGLCLPIALTLVAGCNPPTTTPPPTEPGQTALDQPGSYKIGTYDTSFSTTFGNNDATVYYPATAAGVNTTLDASAAPYPIVAVSPGLGSNKEWNKWIGQHLSTHGYIVMILSVPNGFDSSTDQQQAGLVGALDKLTSENANASSRIYSVADVSKRVIIGHSLGAMASLSVAGRSGIDLDAVIALAPGAVSTTALKNITAPTQIQSASLDCITRPGPALTDYANVGGAFKQIFVITGGNHVGFNDEGSLAETGGDFLIDCDTIDVTDAQQRLSRRFMTAWLDYFVKGQSQYATYISGAKAQTEVTAGRISDLKTQGL